MTSSFLFAKIKQIFESLKFSFIFERVLVLGLGDGFGFLIETLVQLSAKMFKY